MTLSALPRFAHIDYALARDELATQLASIMRSPATATAARPQVAGSHSTIEYDDERIAASWSRPGGPINYVILVDQAVDPVVRQTAVAGREFACAHLGIATPPMMFYVPESASQVAYREHYGVADWLSFAAPDQGGHADLTTRSIGIRADNSPTLVAQIAAHEVLHLTQAGPDAETEERDAQAYGEWAAGVLVSHGKLVGVHRFEGFPYNFKTLPGVANRGDVLIAKDAYDDVGVFVNAGSRARPEWVPHYAKCPISVTRTNG